MRSGLKKFTVRSFEPVALVKPHFAGCGDPVHALARIVIEEKLAFARDSSGDFERDVIDINEIDASRQLKLPWSRRIVGPPRSNIEIGRGPRSAPSLAAKHKREPGPT
jgi:hypothetical protein